MALKWDQSERSQNFRYKVTAVFVRGLFSKAEVRAGRWGVGDRECELTEFYWSLNIQYNRALEKEGVRIFGHGRGRGEERTEWRILGSRIDIWICHEKVSMDMKWTLDNPNFYFSCTEDLRWSGRVLLRRGELTTTNQWSMKNQQEPASDPRKTNENQLVTQREPTINPTKKKGNQRDQTNDTIHANEWWI